MCSPGLSSPLSNQTPSMTATLTNGAPSAREMLLSLSAPFAVKARGADRGPPPLEITPRDFKMAALSCVCRNAPSSGNCHELRFTLGFSLPNITLCGRICVGRRWSRFGVGQKPLNHRGKPGGEMPGVHTAWPRAQLRPPVAGYSADTARMISVQS